MKYKMPDGVIVDTACARAVWAEAGRGDWYARAFGPGPAEREKLYRLRSERYVLEYTRTQGERQSADWLSRPEARAWLLEQGYGALPADLLTE